MNRLTFVAPSLARVFATGSRQVSRTRCSQYRPRMAAHTGAVAPPKAAFEPTIFDKIIAKEIPAKIVYEDDDVLAFHDINPQAPVHVLLIPKKRISMLSTATEADKEILGNLLLKVDVVAKKAELSAGYRVLINNGPDGLQSVYHIHLHIVGGRKLNWGPF